MTRASNATPTTPRPFCPAAAAVPGHVRAVPVVVVDVGVVRDEVPAVHVVDVAVDVVVDAVARHLARVRPQVLDEVGMRRVDARIADRDHDAGAAREVPRRWRGDAREDPRGRQSPVPRSPTYRRTGRSGTTVARRIQSGWAHATAGSRAYAAATSRMSVPGGTSKSSAYVDAKLGPAVAGAAPRRRKSPFHRAASALRRAAGDGAASSTRRTGRAWARW
jgi:hypothetical protein